MCPLTMMSCFYFISRWNNIYADESFTIRSEIFKEYIVSFDFMLTRAVFGLTLLYWNIRHNVLIKTDPKPTKLKPESEDNVVKGVAP